MLVPLYGFLRGDTVGLLVLIHDDHTIEALASTLRQAASMRVAPGPVIRVTAHGRTLDLQTTVAQAGLQALDRVDVETGEPDAAAGEGVR